MLDIINSEEAEKLVCNPEQAEKLRVLGVTQSSLFYWIPNTLSNRDETLKTHLLAFGDQIVFGRFLKDLTLKQRVLSRESNGIVSAFILQELIQIIYKDYFNEIRLFELVSQKLNSGNSFEIAYNLDFIVNTLINYLEKRNV